MKYSDWTPKFREWSRREERKSDEMTVAYENALNDLEEMIKQYPEIDHVVKTMLDQVALNEYQWGFHDGLTFMASVYKE